MGSNSTMANIDVSPGKAPKMIPMKNPMERYNMDRGWKTTEVPARICNIWSMGYLQIWGNLISKTMTYSTYTIAEIRRA